ncbi:MAG: hypothetical protein ACE5LB_07790 [Acidiferrobacterales bacterium]
MTAHARLTSLAVIALLSLQSLALATHEIDHRYDITGFVLDENEKPIAGSPVSIRLGRNIIGYKDTNDQGYYRIRLHLHDADLGKKLLVKTAAGDATIRVTLTPGDRKTDRIHYANFVGGKLVEARLSRLRYSPWLYGAVAALIATPAAIMVGRWNRRRTRRRQRPQAKTTVHKRRRR